MFTRSTPREPTFKLTGRPDCVSAVSSRDVVDSEWKIDQLEAKYVWFLITIGVS